jgi:protein-S-isoprenylcysteine O-methyltransferase Ste14
LVVFWPFNPWTLTVAGLLPGYALILGGATLMAWTLRHNRRGNWQVAPEVIPGARLITAGPYRWVRHPMYAAILALTLGFVVLNQHCLNLAAWAAQLGLFALKIHFEETSLNSAFTDYPAYRKRTGALIPRLR